MAEYSPYEIVEQDELFTVAIKGRPLGDFPWFLQRLKAEVFKKSLEHDLGLVDGDELQAAADILAEREAALT